MKRRRTDMLSETLDEMPWFLRWPMQFVIAFFKVVRVIIALQAIGGAVGFVIGVVTLDGVRAMLGIGQMIFAGFVLGAGFSSEQVWEATGPTGAYVIRTGRHRLWRNAHGVAKVWRFVLGDRIWAANVRRRDDDPFGHVLARRVAETERSAVAEAKLIEEQVRSGNDLEMLGSS